MPSSYSGSYYRAPPPNYAYTPQYDATNISLSTVATCVVASLFLLHYLLASTLSLPTFTDMVGLLLGPGAREYLQNAFPSSPRRTIALGVSHPAAPIAGGIVGGLWNVGNTCYQNSVLQSLASLPSLRTWLDAIPSGAAAAALSDLVATLNTVSDRPRVETASQAITRSVRGWMFNEQQDAQEFLQGLMGVLEKEEAAGRMMNVPGLEAALLPPPATPAVPTPPRSPFEGLLAQRVGCLKCGYVDSISLQPFTTLSLPIPSAYATTLEDCLRAFTEIEQIPQVDCDKCTLLSLHEKLSGLTGMTGPAAAVVRARLAAVTEALENDNFTPKIPGVKLDGALKVSSTKTKQVMIARAPKVLVLHTNRSKFDVVTGVAGKNYAAVEFPTVLDLARLGVVTAHGNISTYPGEPISPVVEGGEDGEGGVVYELRAVVAHFGAHHNGHYVAYRCWAERWWRISDHDVVACKESDALAASNAFMLFYERTSTPTPAQLPLPSPQPSEPSLDLEPTPGPIPNPHIQKHLRLLPTPPESDGEEDLEPEDTLPPPPEMEDVPELESDISSRDSSPKTPPASVDAGGARRRKGGKAKKGKGRGRR